jgi:large subunit ribosomal protein L20
MPRVKRGVSANKKRSKILKYTKGFRWGRKSKEKAAKEALLHAWSDAFIGRKQKKRTYRTKWQVQIGAAAGAEKISYSKVMSGLKKKNIILNRKMLATLAEIEPKVFSKIIAEAK